MDNIYLAKISWYVKMVWYNDIKLVKAKDKVEAQDKIFTYYKSTGDVKPSMVVIDEAII